MSAYERVPVDAPPAAVVDALGDALRSREITVYAVVDHGHDMAAAGVPGFVALTVVFGRPAAGAKLLARDLAAVVDIPLRLGVIGTDAGGSEIVIRDMRSLLAHDLAEVADAFTQVLRTVAEDTRDRAISRPPS
jgi:uncharacterized protein (DUF302 family)